MAHHPSRKSNDCPDRNHHENTQDSRRENSAAASKTDGACDTHTAADRACSTNASEARTANTASGAAEHFPAASGEAETHDAKRSCYLKNLGRWVAPVLGLASLIWFLIRVIPKPSRATYPCQRAAFPVAAGFVTWLVGVITTAVAYSKARLLWRRSRYVVASLALVVAAAAAVLAFSSAPEQFARAYDYEPYSATKTPNAPIGQAVGLNPGRVVWIHDPAATDWDDPTPDDYNDDYWWDDGNTDQAVVDDMVSRAIRLLTGVSSESGAWEALFRNFNSTHGFAAGGYRPGEKIAIKLNFTLTNVNSYNCVDEDGNQLSNLPYNSVSVEMAHSLIDQLVNVAGVPQEDIYIGDPTCYFPAREYYYLSASFPDVNYMTTRDGKSLPGRTKITTSNVEFHFSAPDAVGYTQDYLPDYYANSKYFINFAILKAHLGAVTLCGKNHYGSLNRRPTTGGYYNMHNSLPYINGASGQYRALVDLLGHEQIGGKTLLCILDGLWGGYSWGGVCPPQKWRMAPFNDDHPNSIFMSQDPIAIDSVGFDFWWAEDIVSWDYFPFNASGSRQHMPHLSGGDDYLIEAALAYDPPSGTYYDPENDGVRMGSLGTHEHWNNYTDKQYSRNLGTGSGIQLVTTGADGPVVGRHVFYNNSCYDGFDPAATAADDAAIAADKSAVIAGSIATGVSCVSVSDGITGVMIDIHGLLRTLNGSDFTFELGDGYSWTAAADPSVSVRFGAGVDGSDRVMLTWAAGDVKNCWLRITLTAGVASDLTEDDCFLISSLCGDANGSLSVDLDDFIILKQNYGLSGVAPSSGDFNADGIVDLDDFIVLKQNYGLSLSSMDR